MNETLVYIGTYTRPNKSEGIYLARLNPTTGELSKPAFAAKASNPSFLAIHPNKKFLYSVNEDGEFQGQKQGAVSAFALDEKTGALTPLNQQPTRGTAPCHISVDATGQVLLAANYGGGNVAAFSLGADGKLGAMSDFHQHEGKSINSRRQEGPHAHMILIDPANRYAFVPDLGMDKVVVYGLDPKAGKLKPNAEATVKAGEGPRHFDFHPSQKFGYVITELGNSVVAFAYDAKAGKLTEMQQLSTLPADFKGTSYCADIHVHPSGKWLYGSNRGHDSIACYSIDQGTGKLTLIEVVSTQGKNPRNFGIDPIGKFLLVGGQDTDNIVVFRVDEKTGRLAPTGQNVPAWTPVCLKFLVR